MKKFYFFGLLILGSLVLYAENVNKYIQVCINRCLQAKKICNDKDRLTMTRVRSCEAVDDSFDLNYDCVKPCQKSPRTARFDAVV